MATIVTSIGSNSSIDTETPSSCSGSSSPYSVTFGTTPTGVSIGDRCEIADEALYWGTFVYRVTAISGGTFTLAFVSDGGTGAGDTSPCDLYDSWYNQAPATFKRFYSSITNWEAGLDDSDVYASSDIALGECHNDSVFNETVTINGGGTVGLASVTLSVHADSRHDGTAGTGARMVPAGSSSANIIDIARDDVTVEWLELSGASASAGSARHGVRAFSGSVAPQDNIYIRNNIIHDMKDSTFGSIGITAFFTGTNIFITNNFIYNIVQTNNVASGIYVYQGSGAEVYCNTLFNISTTSGDAEGVYVGSSAELVKDNIVLSVSGTTASKCFSIGTGSANAASDYNLSDDATAWGSNSVTSSDGATAANTIVNTSSGTEDLHLIAGSLAVGAGVDLGTTPAGVEIDIDGRNRDTEGDTWDIGADQAVGLSQTITPTAAAFDVAGVSPSVVQSSLVVTVGAAAIVLAAISPTTTSGSVSITPPAATVQLAAVSPSVTLPVLVTPAVANLEVAAISPTAVAGSLSITPAVGAVDFAGVSPSVQLSSVSVTPSVSSLEVVGISPTVAISSLTITPATATVEMAAISPTVQQGSVSVTPSVSAFELPANNPVVSLGSVALTPATAAVSFAAVTPTIVSGGLSIVPTASGFELAAISPAVTFSSVSVTPSAAAFATSARYASVIAGGIIVIPVETASFVYTAADPSVGLSSQTVAVTASAFQLSGVSPSVIEGSITVTPAVAVVQTSANVDTIYAGIQVTPTAAAFEYIVGSFALHVTMDSASLGYACGGLVDYAGSIPVDYETNGPLDYIGGVLPTDYALEKNLDYKYDHRS